MGRNGLATEPILNTLEIRRANANVDMVAAIATEMHA
jgi:hypothetical protein